MLGTSPHRAVLRVSSLCAVFFRFPCVLIPPIDGRNGDVGVLESCRRHWLGGGVRGAGVATANVLGDVALAGETVLLLQ